MRIKSHSIMIGYNQYEARLAKNGQDVGIETRELGWITKDDYVRHGFTVEQASRAEIQGLIDAGYENSRILLRHYPLGAAEDE